MIHLFDQICVSLGNLNGSLGSWQLMLLKIKENQENSKVSHMTHKILIIKWFSEEFSFSSGQFCGLSPKCYFAFNQDDSTVKLGSKGVPLNSQLELSMYLKRLYDDKEHFIDYESLRMYKNHMARIKTRKTALNSIFTKFRVQSDRVTCLPLQNKNGYI